MISAEASHSYWTSQVKVPVGPSEQENISLQYFWELISVCLSGRLALQRRKSDL